jgi:hypothetical protein
MIENGQEQTLKLTEVDCKMNLGNMGEAFVNKVMNIKVPVNQGIF